MFIPKNRIKRTNTMDLSSQSSQNSEFNKNGIENTNFPTGNWSISEKYGENYGHGKNGLDLETDFGTDLETDFGTDFGTNFGTNVEPLENDYGIIFEHSKKKLDNKYIEILINYNPDNVNEKYVMDVSNKLSNVFWDNYKYVIQPEREILDDFISKLNDKKSCQIHDFNETGFNETNVDKRDEFFYLNKGELLTVNNQQNYSMKIKELYLINHYFTLYYNILYNYNIIFQLLYDTFCISKKIDDNKINFINNKFDYIETLTDNFKRENCDLNFVNKFNVDECIKFLKNTTNYSLLEKIRNNIIQISKYYCSKFLNYKKHLKQELLLTVVELNGGYRKRSKRLVCKTKRVRKIKRTKRRGIKRTRRSK